MRHFSSIDVMWAAEECDRQRTGPMAVYRLLNALGHARDVLYGNGHDHDLFNVSTIKMLGHIVEYRNHKYAFRRVPVVINTVDTGAPVEEIDRLMTELCNADWLDADEWYVEFQRIHPFVDGNGRVGSILWNAYRGSLESPISPPIMFNH